MRQGDAGRYGEIAKLVAEVVTKVPDAQVMADLDATVAWAKAQRRRHRPARRHRLLLGRAHHLAVRARTTRRVKAGVAWYGRLVGARQRR